MTDVDSVPGFPLFTDARGCPINFKLVCDPASKVRYKKLIEKHDGEVLKCQGYPRLILAAKTPCEHLHIGCENHAPYTVAPVFNVTWVDHCISISQLLEIRAYLLNPSPIFAQENYMDQIEEGRYQPPPPVNPVSGPSRCIHSEIKFPYNGTHERHIQETQALCSHICRRSRAPGESSPDHILGTSTASSDEESEENTIMDCMEGLSSQPSSTPRFPPLTANIGTRIRRPGVNVPMPQNSNRSLALPLSNKRTHTVTDERGLTVPISDSGAAQLIPSRTRKEPDEKLGFPIRLPPSVEFHLNNFHLLDLRQEAEPANPFETQNTSTKQQSSSSSNRLSLPKSSSSLRNSEPKKNPRRRELFDSENFTPRFSDDESDPEDMPRTSGSAAPNPFVDLGDRIEVDEDRASTPSPPRSLASAPPSSCSIPRVPALFQPNARPGGPSQPDSDSEFGPPPGSFVRVKGARQNTRAPYSREEEITILKYIKASKKLSGLRSNYIWRDMDGKPGLERRTMQSLKEHFLKKMMGHLERYNIFTDDEIKIIRSKSL